MKTSATAVIDPTVVNHPWVLYALLGVGLLSIGTTFVRRESGAFGEWLARMRRAAEDREDARVGGMAKDIAYLKKKDEEKDDRLAAMEEQLRDIRSERDALVNYLREWWNWALLGAEGAPPSVPEGLRTLLPASSWTWRPGYHARHTVASQPPDAPI